MGCGASKVQVAPEPPAKAPPADDAKPVKPHPTASPAVQDASSVPSPSKSATFVAEASSPVSTPVRPTLTRQDTKSLRSGSGGKWVKAFLDQDPRRQLVEYFKPGDSRGPYGYLRAQGLQQLQRGQPTPL